MVWSIEICLVHVRGPYIFVSDRNVKDKRQQLNPMQSHSEPMLLNSTEF